MRISKKKKAKLYRNAHTLDLLFDAIALGTLLLGDGLPDVDLTQRRAAKVVTYTVHTNDFEDFPYKRQSIKAEYALETCWKSQESSRTFHINVSHQLFILFVLSASRLPLRPSLFPFPCPRNLC